jgi:parallel beta-helix repeat protein
MAAPLHAGPRRVIRHYGDSPLTYRRRQPMLPGLQPMNRRGFSVRRPTLAAICVLALVSALFVIVVPAALAASTVYVNGSSGSDSRSYAEAQNSGTPWASLNKAVSSVQPGDRIVVSAGTYSLSTSRDFSPGITIEGPRGAAGAHVSATFDGASGITMAGFYYGSQLNLFNSNNIVIRDGDVVNDGIEINNSSALTIQGMTLTKLGKAIRIVPGSNITISSNLFTGYTIDGVFINGGTDILVEGNTFQDNGPETGEPNDVHSDVLQAYDTGTTNLTFLNNTVVRNGNVLMILGGTTRNRGLVIEGNYFEDNNGFAIQLSGVQGAILRSNTYVCNGANFGGGDPPCNDPTRFDLKTENSTYTRTNDPANAAQQLREGIAVGAVSSTGRFSLTRGSGESMGFWFGNPGDVPFMGDWDCDGDDTPGLYRQSDGFVYLRNSNTSGPANVSFFYGNPGDVPLAGDWDGDGCDTVSLYRLSEGRMYIRDELGSGAADYSYFFGNPGDVPFVGNFDADSVDELGLHRMSTGYVYLRLTHSSGMANAAFFYGDPGDRIIAGDWDGDGDDTVGIYRPSQQAFYLRNSNSSGVANISFTYETTGTPVVAGL